MFGRAKVRAYLRVVRGHVNLISRAAPQVFQGVLESGRAYLDGLPVAEFGLVMNGVSVYGGVVRRVWPQLHSQRVGRRGG